MCNSEDIFHSQLVKGVIINTQAHKKILLRRDNYLIEDIVAFGFSAKIPSES